MFLKLGKLVREVIVTKGGNSPDLWALVKNCEFFQISSAMMHAIVVGSSGAAAMYLALCKKQVEKQRRQKVVMIRYINFNLSLSYCSLILRIKI